MPGRSTDGSSPASPVLQDGAATYTPGLSERRSGVSKFYHGDLLGSTRAITNSSQTTTDTAVFDAFGMVVSRTGTTPTPFGFAGGWQYQADGDSGLLLLGNRYYDASTGRFLSRDPIQDGTNWYAYCENNPLVWVDPEGLTWIYEQSTGKLYHCHPGPSPDGSGLSYIGTGFSGKRGEPRNNPGYQSVIGQGPIPRGRYKIGPPYNRKNWRKSPSTRIYVLPLTPDPGNQMFGRSAFLIHGGSVQGNPSEGCVIFPKPIRQRIARSGDDELLVIK